MISQSLPWATAGAGDLARRLARDAEAVCRHYLSHGRRHGHYWVAGDVNNTPGRSLYVRLDGPDCGPGAAGKWSDAATGEHGDLLDLIALNRDFSKLGEAMDEARCFLALRRPFSPAAQAQLPPVSRASTEAARRLFRPGRPISGTPAKTYLRHRGITARLDWSALRFYPSVYYRESDEAPLETPAERHDTMSPDDSTFLFPDTDPDTENHTASPTAHLLDELALYGYRPHQDATAIARTRRRREAPRRRGRCSQRHAEWHAP